jgi:hypothetical protein
MSRLAFGAWRPGTSVGISILTKISLRDESSVMLESQIRSKRAHRDPPPTEAHDGGWSYRTERQTPNAKRSRPYFTSFKRSA